MTDATRNLLDRHIDTALAAPEGIVKLRSLILTLAMQGKLVEQDPSDPPTKAMLREIEAQKQRLLEAGKIRRSKALPPIKLEEVPYNLPQGWEWVRLGSIAEYNGRHNISGDEIAADAWLLDLEDIEKGTSRILRRAKFSERQSRSTKSTFQKGDVLYGKLRPYLDKVVVADADGVCTTEIVPIVPFKGVHSEFLRWLLKRPAFLAHVNAHMYGVKMPRLGTEDAITSIHPLPSLPEQRRIVARIDQLMARCDELEELRKKRDENRLAVHTAAIKQLIDEPRASAWSFIQQHFGELYIVKENVAELRKAILQLAVMGRLAPQDPRDSPASELLKEIKAEKQRLVKAGTIKKPKPLPPIKPEDMPRKLPQGWVWVRFGDLATDVATGPFGSMIHKSDYVLDGIPLINPSHMIDGKIAHDSSVSVSPSKARKLMAYKLFENDIVMARRGEMGRCAIVTAESDGFLCGTGSFVLRFIDKINRQYILNLFMTEYVREYLQGKSVGTTMTNLNHGILNNMPVLLPPHSEQHRIVSRIEQLMTLCDGLDKQIDAATNKQSLLLDAVMAQV